MASQAVTTTEAPRKTPVQAGAKLAAFIPQTLDEAWRLAGALASSGMTPKSYGQDQNKIMVGMMAGAEVGLTPMAALQSIAVIGNNPSIWGDGALGLVQASGLLEDMEETDDGQTATCMVKRKGRATLIVRSFSMDDAKKAGLAGKAGPWTQYPARMRQMRARAFALRDGFADVLRGLHIVEEVRDYAPMDGGRVQAQSQPLTAAMLEHQAGGEGYDAETGEVQTGRTDEQHGDQHDGTEDHPFAATAAALTERANRAETVIDLGNIEAELGKHRDVAPEDLVAGVDDAIAARRAALTGGK